MKKLITIVLFLILFLSTHLSLNHIWGGGSSLTFFGIVFSTLGYSSFSTALWYFILSIPFSSTFRIPSLLTFFLVSFCSLRMISALLLFGALCFLLVFGSGGIWYVLPWLICALLGVLRREYLWKRALLFTWLNQCCGTWWYIVTGKKLSLVLYTALIPLVLQERAILFVTSLLLLTVVKRKERTVARRKDASLAKQS